MLWKSGGWAGWVRDCANGNRGRRGARNGRWCARYGRDDGDPTRGDGRVRAEPSTVPGQVGAHLIPGKDPDDDADVQQLNAGVHWGHGITMGAVRGLLDAAGVKGPAASAVHFGLLWVSDAVLYKWLGIADMPWRWTGREIATDVTHKGVYAAVTGAAYDAMAAKTTR